MQATGWQSGAGVLIRDRVTDAAYTVHAGCLEELRTIVREQTDYVGERFAEMGPVFAGDECGKCGGTL